MIPASFDYARAKSVNDALKALAAGDGSKVIAGGQSLIPLLRFRLASAPKLVDIGHLPKLKGVRKVRGGVRIGATTTFRELLDSEVVRTAFPIMAEAIEGVGDRQVRNRGTIGGNLAHADPASDLPAVMLALGASFTLSARAGSERSRHTRSSRVRSLRP